MSTPTLTLARIVPDAVRRAELAPGHKLRWTLKAEFPAPHGTVFLRYSEPEQGDNRLDVLTAAGKRLHRLEDVGLGAAVPAGLRAEWLEPHARKSPLASFTQPDDERKPRRFWLSFPDGFSGICTQSREWGDATKYAWNGLRFVEAASARQPDAIDVSFPSALASKNVTRFGAAVFGGRRFLLRWVAAGERATLEVLDVRRRLLGRHRLADDFSATTFRSLSAMWLDEKRKRGPILEARDSDSVRLHVFSDNLSRLICAQDFNDGSSSISATTVVFGRDKRGVLTVTESYSERGGEDGSGGESHDTDYVWSGRSFQEKK
jgi:hypothetical protein